MPVGPNSPLMTTARRIAHRSRRLATGIVLLALAGFSLTGYGAAEPVSEHLEGLKDKPIQLRQFLQRFPKGGDLHSHLSGAVYAESYLQWGAEDGKCINLSTQVITLPPCSPVGSGVSLAELVTGITPNTSLGVQIDALSVRNYQRREESGHDQFFATFERFTPATFGRLGDMVAQVSTRAARQNILYLELMQSLGMFEAAALAATTGNLDADYGSRLEHSAIDELVSKVSADLDAIENRRAELQGCSADAATGGLGCQVTVRYLAQVIRTLSPIQVYAQTLLAFKLMAADPRVVGLNFVAPEDHPVALRDYRQHMGFLAEIGARFPEHQSGITLHAGELTLGLVPPEDLGWHIDEAITVAGARRIGHGIDIAYDDDMAGLLQQMAQEDILVEINLTSNDVILQVSGAEHPFTTYLQYGVPLALSTDDEGVSRIDLTHEYQRAVTTFDLSYPLLRSLSRNSLQYSFLPGAPLFVDTFNAETVAVCGQNALGDVNPSAGCANFLGSSPKARLQWHLEKRIKEFEAEF